MAPDVAAPAETLRGADPDRTVALSREEIEAAIFGGSMPDPAEAHAADPTSPPEPPWEPPADVEEQIVRFNARHKILFRTIRAEVGAGAQNFVRSCRSALLDGSGEMFDDVPLNPDGTFDTPSLRKGIVARRDAEPWTTFRNLLEQEVTMLRVHVGEKRAVALVEEMERI
jgi:hypothetical protein